MATKEYYELKALLSLTPKEQAQIKLTWRNVKRLLLIGLKADTISRRLNMPRETVEMVLKSLRFSRKVKKGV